jgi:Cu(I)/Ag(I) efflux system membrane fusion protein
MKKINKTTIVIILITLIVGISLGGLLFSNSEEKHQHTTQPEEEQQIWTCSMHPQIRKTEAGKCPICGMDLIPLSNESGAENPMEIKMSPSAMQLANIQTSVIKKQKPVKEVRMNGKIKADERLIFSQSAHLSGRIEKLLVNFTGESVSKGQTLAYIYSPELVTAQEELFEALKIKNSQPALFEAAKAKLKNWKLTESQINKIIESGQPQSQFPILADVNGIVLNKRVNLGDYIQKGESLLEIANLSKVWVLFDVYESDMPWIKVDNAVKFSVQSLPAETFIGKITFIDPIINPTTRVATARVEINNSNGRLKPDMFVKGVAQNPIKNQKEALIVPKSAVMWTGERSVVYVKNSSAAGIGFVMREVTLGASLGNSYVIESGLSEGEEIATNGTFSIDAAAQLAGKPSMMNPEGGKVSTGHNHGSMEGHTAPSSPQKEVSVNTSVKKLLTPLFDKYFLLKEALVKDDFKTSKKHAAALLKQLNKINMTVFKGEAHNIWMEQSSTIKKALTAIEKEDNIKGIRQHFITLSNSFIQLAKAFKPFQERVFIQHCPMTNNNSGADWISKSEEILNPYFGASMLNCGNVKEEIK